MPYKYVVGLHEGKTLLLGPYPEDTDTADQLAMEKFDTNSYEVFTSIYRDNTKVTQQLKEGKIRIDDFDISSALQRVGHKVPVGG